MLIIGSRESIKSYRENPAINQSTLKDLQYGLANFLKKQTEDGPIASFEVGSAVDCILTAPEGSFSEEYYISSVEKKPTEVEMDIINAVFKMALEQGSPLENFVDYKQYIERAILNIGWQPNWKIETRVDKISNSTICQGYFEDLKNSVGKTVLSVKQYENITKVVDSLKENERTKNYFDRRIIEGSQEILFLYQVPIYFKFERQDCKALPDIVIMKIEDGKITEILVSDLKTTSKPTTEFFDSVIKYRYDIQASWYLTAISNIGTEYCTYPLSETVKILPFQFIVESTIAPGNPLVYEVDSSLIKQGRFGTEDVFVNSNNGEKCLIKKGKKGFESLLKELVYYQETQFQEDIIQKEKNGILKIDINGIV